MSVMRSMKTVSPHLYPVSSTQKLSINGISWKRLLRKKSCSTNSMFFCVDQVSTNFSSALHSYANNGKNSTGLVGKDSVSLTYNDQSSSEMHDGLGIIDFFCGKKLLITGATGFLAKVLVEKILRSMPDVDKIFLLIKAKNEEAAMERCMNEIINTELFKCLREKHGTFFERFMLSKLVPVVGNMCETDIGFEEDVANLIAREVDVIINSAATTTFDERYDVSLDINTGGAARMVSFAKKCENLKLYVHVSTAYVCRQREGKILEESLGKGHYVASNANTFESPKKHVTGLNIEAEMKFALEMKGSFRDSEKEEKLKELGMKRAQKYGWPNTYAFTKAMGEMVIEDIKGELPVIIIRPTVVESTLKQPFPGWIEGNRMMDPIILWYGKGKVPGFVSSPNITLDVVPVDIFVNATLAAIAKHGGEGSKLKAVSSSDYHVYHIASSVANPLFTRDLLDMAYQHFSSNPFFDRKGNSIQISPYQFFTSIEDMLLTMENTVGNEEISPKQELVRRQSMNHIKYFANLYHPYTFFNGRFDNSKAEELLKCLSEEERKEFGFDVSSIDWNDYIKSVHFPGIRKHVLKERALE